MSHKMGNSETNKSTLGESALRSQLLQSEKNLDESVTRKLADARANAIAQENNWFTDYYERLCKGYRGAFSASVVTAAFSVVIFLPAGEKLLSIDESGLNGEDSVTLLMEDPEFYLWLDKEGMLVAER